MLRKRTLVFGGYVVACAVWACSGTNESGFTATDGGGSGSGSGGSGSGSGGSGSGGSGGPGFDGSIGTNGESGVPQGEASVTVHTTIYANTDDSLYSVDPKTNAVTLIGPFSGGLTDASTNAAATDVAVNAAGDVYINSESVVYKATLPTTPPGPVTLTSVTTINAPSGTRFYALAFAPAGAVGTGETLIGGDGSGNLWSIDIATGATVNLGNFGNDPNDSTRFMALSGDVVFYVDSSGKNQGLATIRSCAPPTKPGYSPSCYKTNDYLAGVDMTALAAAFTSGTPAKSLNAGIYGGSSTTLGNGIGHGEVFGLGAVEGNVLGFSRFQNADAGPEVPALWSIDTSTGSTSGSGTVLPGSFSFTNGWSGAGVTSSVTIVVPPPPPPPPPPK